MRVVDTSAWIEWLTGSALGKQVENELPEGAQWVVPTMVQLELSKWLLRENGEDEADRVIAFSMMCKVVPLDTRLALLPWSRTASTGWPVLTPLSMQRHRAEGLAC